MQNEHLVKLTALRSLLRSLVPKTAAASLEHSLLRPDDQLRLRFELVNGQVDPEALALFRTGTEDLAAKALEAVRRLT